MSIAPRSHVRTADNVDWTFRPVLRPVHFAGRTLFRVPVPLYVCESHFHQLPLDPDALITPLATDLDAPGAYVRSQPVRADLPRFEQRAGMLRYVPHHYDRTLVRKRGTFTEYLAQFSAKERYNLKRNVRKLAEAAGGDALRLFRDASEVAPFLERVQIITPRTYQARLYGNQLGDTPDWRARLAALAVEDRLRGYVLSLGDRPIAFWLFARLDDVLLSEYTGFDPEHRALSPGTALLYQVLEQMFADPQIAALDFGEGDAVYKQKFGTDTQRCAEIFYLRPRVRNAEMVVADQAAWLAKRAIAPLDRELERRGWRAPLKRFVRQFGVGGDAS